MNPITGFVQENNLVSIELSNAMGSIDKIFSLPEVTGRISFLEFIGSLSTAEWTRFYDNCGPALLTQDTLKPEYLLLYFNHPHTDII